MLISLFVWACTCLPLVVFAFMSAVDSRNFWASKWGALAACYVFIEFIWGCMLLAWICVWLVGALI